MFHKTAYTTNPSHAVQIDWSNPITAGHIAIWRADGTDRGIELVRNFIPAPSTVDGPTATVSTLGQAVKFGGNANTRLPLRDYALSGTMPITVWALLRHNATTGNQTYVAQGTEVVLRGSDTVAEFILNTFATNDRVTVTGLASSLNKPTLIVGTYGASGLIRLYRDGVLLGSVTPTGSYADVAADYHIGQGGGLITPTGDFFIAGVANREMTPEEVRRLNENPFQVLKAPSRKYFQFPAGSTFSQAITATSPVTASIIKTISKIFAASSSASASVAKSVSKIIATTSASATSFVRSVLKIVSLSSPVTATLTALKLFLVAITATSAAATSIIKRVGKPIAVSSASVTSFVRSIAKTVSAASASAASTVKSIYKPITATSPVTATLTALKLLLVTISAASATTVSAVKSVLKIVSASSSGSASAVKSIYKTLSSSAVSTASTIKSIGKQIIISSASAPSIVKSIRKIVSMQSAVTATLATLAVVVAVAYRKLRARSIKAYVAAKSSGARLYAQLKAKIDAK